MTQICKICKINGNRIGVIKYNKNYCQIVFRVETYLHHILLRPQFTSVTWVRGSKGMTTYFIYLVIFRNRIMIDQFNA